VQPYPTLPAPGIFNDAAEARADAPAMDAAPLESLGLVQLIERLAMAIAVRRDELARHAEQDPRAEAEVDAAPPPGTATHARTRPNRAWRTRKQVGRRMRRLSWRSCPARRRCPNTAIPRWSICHPRAAPP
jgi:hypothetical protein